jgi:TP901 family phage tail tape measure protein
MAANVVDIVVKASDDTAGGFDAAKASSAAAADSAKVYADALDDQAMAEGKLRDAQIQQTDAQLKLEELQQSGTASAAELAAAQDKVTTATLRAADAQIRLGEADERVALAEKGAGDAAITTAAKTDEGAGAAEAGAIGLSKFGMVGGLALAGVGYEAIKMSMNFQSAMERLVTQAGVPQKMLGPLKSGILSVAGAVGFSPESLSESLYHVASNMASLGAKAPEMLSMVKTAAEGAAVGGANLEDVTNALTAAVASGIPGVQNFGQAMGALNAIVGAGDMKMQDLAEAMGSGLMAVVKGYGLSLADVGAALDTFGDNNIRGAHAATDLRMAVQALAVPAAAGKAELASMGLSMTSLATTMRQHGLLAALEELQDRFKKAGITAAEQGEAITNIFGKKAGVGLAVLMDQMDRLKSKYPAIKAGADDFGKAWERTQGTLKQQWDEIKASFDSLLTGIGDKVIPVIEKFTGFLLKNKGILETLAPVILAIVAAFTAWAGIMKVIEIVSDMNPWTLAIMAVIAVVVLLVEHWKTVERVAKEVFGAIEHVILEAVDFIRSHWQLLLAILTGPIGLAVLFIKDNWKHITDAFSDVIDWIKSHWQLILAIITGPIGLAVLFVKDHLSQITGFFKDVFDRVTGDVRNWEMDVGHEFEHLFDMLGQVTRAGLGDVVHWFEGLPALILRALSNLGSMMFNAGRHVISSLLDGVKSMIGDVGSVVGGIAHKIAGFFGLSPAVEGPLSGGGAPEIRGAHFAAAFAAGMLSGDSAVRSAAARLAASAGTGGGAVSGLAGGGAAGGPMVLQIQLGSGGSGLDQQFMTWLKNAVRAGGGDPRMFNKKVQFVS